jgi:aromatic ring-cleaving dioxygenase
MGAFLVLVGEGSQELSFSLNEEACITVSLAHPDDGALVDWLASQTGGADFVVRHGSPVDADLPSMMELCGGITFSLMGEEDHTDHQVWYGFPWGIPTDDAGYLRSVPKNLISAKSLHGPFHPFQGSDDVLSPYSVVEPDELPVGVSAKPGSVIDGHRGSFVRRTG